MIKQGLIPREGQENLMLDIGEAMEKGNPLIAEAGVGIGKSFAYLIPGLIQSLRTGKPLIVSSSSIQLTEQLVSDVEKVSQILSNPFTYVVGKGRTNYPCFKRYKSVSSRFKEDFSNIETLQRAWNKELLTPSEKSSIQVESCLFNRCEYRYSCDFYNMRQHLGGRNRVPINCLIVNHNLLIEDFKKKSLRQKGLIMDGHSIVIDEAHKLEDVVRDALNQKLTLYNVKKMKKLIKDLRLKSYDMDLLEKNLFSLFSTLHNHLVEKHAIEASYIFNNRLDIKDLVKSSRKEIDGLLTRLDLLQKELTYLDYDESKEGVYEEAEILVDSFYSYLEALITDEAVYWAVYERKFSCEGLSLCSAPKNINKVINQLLFTHDKSVILTSATLGTGSDRSDLHSYYGYQHMSLGLPEYTECSQPESSPYDYKRNTRLYLPKDEIDVRMDESTEMIAWEIKRLADLFEGRTMVLFTSKRQLDQVGSVLCDLSEESVWTLIRQNESKSVRMLQKEFTSGGAKVLLATGSFWEGVNIKGAALSCLIVVKLPYPVPDPIIQHKTTMISNVIEHEMIIKLKQGTGRLIRSEEDKGVVAILDKRVLQKPEIISALPFGPILHDMKEVIKYKEENMSGLLHF